ncbi:gasdermin-E-like [Glandiceps talaboti]
MFEAATENFVKVVGRDALLPPPSLESAINCKPLSLVVKLQPKWPWQSPTYIPQPFRLLETLEKCKEREEGLSLMCQKLTEFKNSLNVMVKGKIGCEILHLFDINVKGQDSICLHVDFGAINRADVQVPALAEFLKKVYLDPENTFVQWMKKHSRHKLCLIIGTFYTTEHSSICVSTKKSVSQEAKVETSAHITFKEKFSMSDQETKRLMIPAYTTIAYKVCDVNVTANGALELVTFGSPNLLSTEIDLGVDLQEQQSSDNGHPTINVPWEVFLETTSEEKRRLYRFYKAVIDMPCCLKPLRALIMEVLSATENGDHQSAFDYKDMEEMFSKFPIDWKTLLSLLGFTTSEEIITISNESFSTTMLHSACFLVEALLEMCDDQYIVLKESNEKQYTALLNMISQSSCVFVDCNDVITGIPEDMRVSTHGIVSNPQYDGGHSWELHGIKEQCITKQPQTKADIFCVILRMLLEFANVYRG